MATSGWNRPSANKPITPRKNNSVAKGLIAGLIVVILAAIAAYFIFPSAPERKPDKEVEKKSGLIGEATPAAAPKYQEETKPEVPPKPKEPQFVTNLQNAALGEDGRVYFVPRPGHKLVTNDVQRIKPYYQIFKHGYQNELASYLTAIPGESFVGEMRYSDRFVKEVIETMSLPIEDDPDDTPEQRELRQNMREVMKAIKEEVDNGRMVSDIFRETREELQQLGDYRQTLEDEVRKMYRDSNMSDQDVIDAIDAANLMLEKKGISPMKFGKIAKEIIKYGRDVRPAEEKDVE